MYLQLFLSGILYLVLFYFTFVPFGLHLLNRQKTKLSEIEKLVLASLVSFALFVVLAFTFAFINLRGLVLPTVVLVNAFAIRKLGKKVFAPLFSFKDKVFSLLIFIGIIVQGFINFPSGIKYGSELLFWSSQGHDGLWHVALLEEIKKSLPLINPLFAGEYLYNYHYLSDVLAGEFIRIFPFFSSLDVYFRFFPIVVSILIGSSVYAFCTRWQKNSSVGLWAMFFTYLAGSFGYIVLYLKSGKVFGGETIFWASQNNTILGNPPHAVAFIFLCGIFLAFLLYTKTRAKFWFWTTLLFAFMLGGFKVSAGLIAVVGLSAAAFIDLLVNKQGKTVLLAVLVGISNLVVVKLLTRGVTSFLIFEPWWFVRTMVVTPDRLNWIELEHRRQHYATRGTWKGFLRVLQIEGQSFLIFLIGNLGTKFLGLFGLFGAVVSKARPFFKSTIDVFLVTSAFVALLIPMLFVQKGITFNNIQFMQYFMLIVGFYAAVFVNNLSTKIKSKQLKFALVVLLIALSTPTVIGNLVEFYGPGRTALAKISQADQEALLYLKENSAEDAVILSVPFDKDLRYKYTAQPQPWPIYVWYSTPYIPALAARRTYLTAEEQVDITDYYFEDRLANMEKFFEGSDATWNREFLTTNAINYVYVAKAELEVLPLEEPNDLMVVFNNDEVVIYKVNEK